MLQQSSDVFTHARKGPKHHYIPVLYLRQWKGVDGRLCEYSRPYDRVKPLRKHPDGTGYERGLYTIPNIPHASADVLETKFFAVADNLAALALNILLRPDDAERDFDVKLRAAWARFVYSLLLRTPEFLQRNQNTPAKFAAESLEKIRNSYISLRQPNDPPTFEEFRAKALNNPTITSIQSCLHRLIDSGPVLTEIMKMQWFTVTMNGARYSLLSSDRPVMMTNGIKREDAQIAVPISPRHLFLAVRSGATARRIRSMPSEEIVRQVNDRVCRQSRKYVYGLDDSQLRFVEKRLGQMVPASPLDT